MVAGWIETDESIKYGVGKIIVGSSYSFNHIYVDKIKSASS